MFEIVMLNEYGKKFSKFFNSEYKFNKFLSKLKYSKKIKLLSYRRIY